MYPGNIVSPWRNTRLPNIIVLRDEYACCGLSPVSTPIVRLSALWHGACYALSSN